MSNRPISKKDVEEALDIWNREASRLGYVPVHRYTQKVRGEVQAWLEGAGESPIHAWRDHLRYFFPNVPKPTVQDFTREGKQKCFY